MRFAFFRAACASPALVVADCAANAERICAVMRQAAEAGVSLLVLPELSVTAYTCGDLFLQQSLRRAAIAALEKIAQSTAGLPLLAIAGVPVASGAALYNCAAFLHRGKILALVPKTYIPNYGEFYEKRHFASAAALDAGLAARLSDSFPAVPFGVDILIADAKNHDVVIAAELCEDLWTPSPPSTGYALSGATIIANLSASNEVIGKAAYRRQLAASQSGRLACAYLYADAGCGESTTDMVFSGHNIIAENGAILAESEFFSDGLLIADIDTERLTQERRRMGTFSDSAARASGAGGGQRAPCRVVYADLCSEEGEAKMGFSSRREASGGEKSLCRRIDPRPFVPADDGERKTRCKEVIALQAHALAKRLRHTGAKTAVVGVSGGLDSTLALLVTRRAFELCALPLSGIHAITMPCFGTTSRTKTNARNLARALGVTLREIPIEKAVTQHFADIGHNGDDRDVTYENSQARERTQVLMDYANKTGGIVIGTGDLSELALGWATYNGDHMSMYGVNSSIPKTLVRYLIEWFMREAEDAGGQGTGGMAETLRDILDTPVSPELVPGVDGEIAQKTEDIVGPYELHDFFLYYMIRWGFSPAKIYFLAKEAFCHSEGGSLPPAPRQALPVAATPPSYQPEVIRKWLKVFYTRFFSQQFKRSCLPDGAKVGTVSLSPRGDWRMPSDASCAVWLKEIDNLVL